MSEQTELFRNLESLWRGYHMANEHRGLAEDCPNQPCQKYGQTVLTLRTRLETAEALVRDAAKHAENVCGCHYAEHEGLEDWLEEADVFLDALSAPESTEASE